MMAAETALHRLLRPKHAAALSALEVHIGLRLSRGSAGRCGKQETAESLTTSANWKVLAIVLYGADGVYGFSKLKREQVSQATLCSLDARTPPHPPPPRAPRAPLIPCSISCLPCLPSWLVTFLPSSPFYSSCLLPASRFSATDMIACVCVCVCVCAVARRPRGGPRPDAISPPRRLPPRPCTYLRQGGCGSANDAVRMRRGWKQPLSA